MSMTNASWNAFMALLVTNVDWALVGDAGGLQNSAVNGFTYLSLYTASPGAAGTQLTNETAYTNYLRVAVTRDPVGGIWTIAAGAATNAGVITFAQCGVVGATITHVGIGAAAAGAGQLWAYVALTAPKVLVNLDPVGFDANALTFQLC